MSISDDRLAQDLRYDAHASLLGRTTTVNGVTLYRYDVTRDLSGRVTGRTTRSGAAPEVVTTYGYDDAGRLTSVFEGGVAVEAYGYDERDNRTSRSVAAGSPEVATYTADDRILTHAGEAALQDLDGQLTTRGADTFVHGSRGGLLTADVGGVAVSYGYDGLGRRVRRTVGASTWRYVYGNPDNDAQLSGMIDPSSGWWTFLYDGLGALVAFDKGGASPTRYYVATDQLGSPTVVADRDGNVVDELTYDAFGRVLSESAPAFDLPIGFAGGLRDRTTGRVRFGVRDYDPELGRFTTRDPIMFGGGQTNLYAYVRNDPARHIDPSGTFSVEVGICKFLCVDTKLAITKEGISACVGTGVAIGDTIDMNPDGGLDNTNDFFVKGNAGISAGPLAASLEIELETPDCGTIKPKFCLSIICLGDALDPDIEQAGADVKGLEQMEKALEDLRPPKADSGKKGIEVTGSVLGFNCQQLKW